MPLDRIYTAVYTKYRKKVIVMMTAKIFENGRSQAVRLPKEFRFSVDEVMVNKIGEIVILMPKTNKWASFMQAIDMFSDDFMENGRADQGGQEREAL
jgi:antitoxin VapB